MTLLDDDSRAVLGLLRRTTHESQQALQHSTAPHGHRNPLASDITNRPAKVVRTALTASMALETLACCIALHSTLSNCKPSACTSIHRIRRDACFEVHT